MPIKTYPAYYILRDKTPVKCTLMEWARWFEETAKAGSLGRHVAHDEVGDDMRGRYYVSTVFLGLDHNYWDHGPPILFETMVFKHEPWTDSFGHEHAVKSADVDGWFDRYATWDKAEAGHRRIFNKVKAHVFGIRAIS